MIKLKDLITEWYHQPPKEKRWSKKYGGDSSLTDFEDRGGKDSVKEGPRDFIHHSQAKAIQIPKKDVKKAQKLLKKFKWQVEFDTKPVRKPGHIKVTTTKKVFNSVLEILVKNGINPGG
jgi:hypothetical protein